MSLQDLIFNRLVRLNSEGEIDPDLAESWDISADGLIYTFHLRKGVRFHDGVECTADDVKFTYDKIIDPGTDSPFRQIFELAGDFQADDKYTFRIILKKPSASFIYRLTREVVPKHILERGSLKNNAFNFHPIGTGPFKFKELKDEQIALEYNVDYYEGRPYLDKIIVKVYPDSSSLWNALMRGEVNYATFIEREDYELIKNDDSFKTYAFPVDSYYAIFYKIDNSLLSDKNLREAVAYSINRKELIEKLAYGYGIECSGPFYPESSLFNSAVKTYKYNPEKAKKLLKETGWVDSDGDGILERSGEEFELRVLVDTRSEIYQKIIMLIRQQLQEIGIKIKVVLCTGEEKLTKEFFENNKPQAQLSFPMAIGDDAESAGLEYWLGRQSERISKLWIFKNENVDKLFELAEVTLDKKEREEIYRKIHQLIYADQPACFLYFPYVFHAVSAKFDNVDEFFTLYMPYYTIKDWYLKNERR
ncbi:MAG: ABC transporter substrate-binding protein [Candidatus Omnitrophica bacterium]|nr:ABC transporter substrate-binding protein [Candidatus Omnitrophota bacterium]